MIVLGKFLLILAVFWFAVRIFVRRSGQIQKLWEFFAHFSLIFVLSACFSLIIGKTMAGLGFGALLVGSLCARTPLFLQKRKILSQECIENALSDLIFLMESGISFDSAVRKVSLRAEIGEILDGELGNLVSECRKSPSQAYKVVVCERENLRQVARLEQKQNAVTLQARSQAIVCLILYLLLFTMQLLLNPAFSKFIRLPQGAILIVFSSGLVGLGAYFVFRISTFRRPVL